jgi:hypothetical protein
VQERIVVPIMMQCRELMTRFRYINFYWIPRSQNDEANDLAQKASGYKVNTDKADFSVQFLETGDWRADIFNYLKDPARGAPKRIRYKAMKYILIGDDMFYRTLERLLLKYLGPTEVNRLQHEVHEGACGTHQSAHKMKWLIRRSGYYWPTKLKNSFKYYKGCQACQRFRKIQMVPTSVMNPIIKPWPFRGWGMDMIGKINPPSSKGHQYILANIDYFTKWVEVIPMKSVTLKDVVNFIKEHVIHRFGIPQTITTDGGSVFISKDRLHTMPKQMDKLRHPIRALSSLSRGKLMNTLGVGTKFYRKHCGPTAFHVMEQQKLCHIIWCMDRRLCYHGRLRPAQDA